MEAQDDVNFEKISKFVWTALGSRQLIAVLLFAIFVQGCDHNTKLEKIYKASGDFRGLESVLWQIHEILEKR